MTRDSGDLAEPQLVQRVSARPETLARKAAGKTLKCLRATSLADMQPTQA